MAKDWSCAPSLAAHIPTGEEGSLCFGLKKSQYVPFWCAVGAVTLAIYLVIRARESAKAAKAKKGGKKAAAAGGVFQRLKKLFKPAGARVELEEGLLGASDDGAALRAATQVASEKMSQVCVDLGATQGLEAASVAVLMVLLQRRRFNAVTLGVQLVGAKSPKEVCVEIPETQTSFASLLISVDRALKETAGPSSAQAASEVPEVVLTWSAGESTGAAAEAPAMGKWALHKGSAGRLVVQTFCLEDERGFQMLFESCASNPQGDVWQQPLLPQDSLDKVKAWGAATNNLAKFREQTGRLVPVPKLLAQRKDNLAGDAVAGDGFCISFEELRRRAAAVTQAVKQNADPSKKKAVVVYMGRGEAIGPAFIGVLQAGYHVVPVDVHWPSDRVRQVTEDCEAGLALLEPSSLLAWSGLGQTSPKALVVDDAFYAGAGVVDGGMQVELDQDDPAIVLFTSGSTGRPKGIVLSHGYLTALMVGVAESKRMTGVTRTLCYHSPTWMPFLDYLFAPLIMGGCCLYFPESETHVVKPTDLKAFAQRHNATNAGFVPAMLDILVEEGLPKSLTDVGVGGAAVPAELCSRALTALAPGVLYTGYSGTEQGDVTQIKMRVDADVENGTADGGFMGAGRPHGSQTLAILDAGLRTVGPGGVGEVCVSGPGLATEYLKLPEKTAETFLGSCEALGGQRAARSGDLGRWTVDGNLKIVGRRDSMVKVRGARIEIGEVEAAVGAHPAVKAAIVTVFEDKLVAYVVPAVPADLRDFCKERLVAYMVPHLFQGLEEIPRLANGKVNKKALPTPEERADGAETVMELDSLGQMRKFTRKAASEDRVLDNVRAILIGVVIQSHAIPLMANKLGMIDVAFNALPAEWGPMQYFLLKITRGGGWSSLAFLNGFDDTRAMRPYGLTYREPLFLALWLLFDFNWTMWYLPVFVYMRAVFCAAHWVGLERTHLLVASQFFILLPAFVDLYIGWQPGPEEPCPEQCFCPWQAWPWAQKFAHYTSGWWVDSGDPTGNSMVGHALIFIPCYWIGFYTGGGIFKVLTKVADEPSKVRRALIAGSVLALYCAMYSVGQPVKQAFNDRCSSFWGPGDSLVWVQVLKNVGYYTMNLSMSLTYVVFIAAAVPVHLKYLAKICFSSLIMSPLGGIPCLLDFSSQALAIRAVLSPAISPAVEMLWVFTVPFLFELVSGAVVTAILPVVIKGCISLVGSIKARVRSARKQLA